MLASRTHVSFLLSAVIILLTGFASAQDLIIRNARIFDGVNADLSASQDIAIVEGNPLEDITVMTKPQDNFKVRVKGGSVHKNSL